MKKMFDVLAALLRGETFEVSVVIENWYDGNTYVGSTTLSQENAEDEIEIDMSVMQMLPQAHIAR